MLIYFASGADARFKPSPPGGGYIEFDSDDDFLSTVKPWLPDERPQTLTVEGWIYLESIPKPGTRWSIIGQENRFEISMSNSDNTGSSFGVVVYGDDNIMCTCMSAVPGLPLGKWTHFIVWYTPTISYGLNGIGNPNNAPRGFIFASSSPLRIGGIVPEMEGKCYVGGENAFFRGYIDEVRISSVMRWKQAQGAFYEIPKNGFKPDKDTIGLWHFDEDTEINGYQDSSGNGWTLWKNESYDVQPENKLHTLWGKIKDSRNNF